MDRVDVMLAESMRTADCDLFELEDYERVAENRWQHKDGTLLRVISQDSPNMLRGLRIRNLFPSGRVRARVWAMARERLRDGS